MPVKHLPEDSIERITDPALVVSMPGCFLENINSRADRYFYERSRKRLGDYVRQHPRECLCDVLVGPSAYLAQFCPIEVASAEIERLGRTEQHLIALRYDEHRDASPGEAREYELFLAHYKLVNDSMLGIRMLPFPSEMKLRVVDLPGVSPGAKFAALPSLPCGIKVNVPTLLAETQYTWRGLAAENGLAELQMAGRFLDIASQKLAQGATPIEAWGAAGITCPNVSSEIPLSVADYFNGKTAGSAEDLRKRILDIWRHPLDAPVLMRFVFPAIMDRIQNDRHLSCTPRGGNNEDRNRYYRLHIPIEELEKQDHYVGWLPSESNYRDERSSARDALHGH